MKRHVPTSAILEQLLRDLPADSVSFEWLLTRLERRSFGVLLLILAIAGLVPGAGIFIGTLLLFPAGQMILARKTPSLPRFLASRSIASKHIIPWATRAISLFRRMEKLIKPRMALPFDTTKRVVGVVVLLLAITVIWPFPFGHVIPLLVIMLISFAYLEKDGALLCVSLAAALLSFAFTAATVWATIKATHFLERLWSAL